MRFENKKILSVPRAHKDAELFKSSQESLRNVKRFDGTAYKIVLQRNITKTIRAALSCQSLPCALSAFRSESCYRVITRSHREQRATQTHPKADISETNTARYRRDRNDFLMKCNQTIICLFHSFSVIEKAERDWERLSAIFKQIIRGFCEGEKRLILTSKFSCDLIKELRGE